MEPWNDYLLGDMFARYVRDTQSGTIGLLLIPAEKTSSISNSRYQPDSLLQLKLLGDDYPGGFAHGHSMRNSGTVSQLKFDNQYQIDEEDRLTIATAFKTPSLCRVVHYLVYHLSYKVVESYVTFTNEGENPVTLEMLASFSLTGITPFADDDASESLILHRILSSWSAEGRLASDVLAKLNFQPAWLLLVRDAFALGRLAAYLLVNIFLQRLLRIRTRT